MTVRGFCFAFFVSSSAASSAFLLAHKKEIVATFLIPNNTSLSDLTDRRFQRSVVLVPPATPQVRASEVSLKKEVQLKTEISNLQVWRAY